MQLGHEISQSKGFGGSSNGTTDRKITFESNHITLQCPTYLPGVDDSDQSTWTSETRFVKVEPVLDHKAKTQFEGTKELAEEQEFQNMDHASDGKKKLALCSEWKKEIMTEDFGHASIKALKSGDFQNSLSALTKEDIEKAYQEVKLEVSQESDIDRETVTKLIAQIIGQEVVDSMSDKDRELRLAIMFAGCCSHKDLNAFKYRCAKMAAGWEEQGKTLPVLLTNKAHAATICLGDADSAAVQNAIDSSTCGGVKVASLAGSLFNHSDDKRGYLERHQAFMKDQKEKLHGIKDASQTLTYLDSYHLLMEDFRDSKDKPGFNHIEANLNKALYDIPTITEMAAMTVYGLTISWPYLGIVHGEGSKVQNALNQDLIDLHRHLPEFCESIAANPDLLLEANISAAEGWRQFTKEYAPGGPFDSLTPEQQAQIFILATNDANEGALGSYTAMSFSNKMCLEQNNTKNFITKLCEADDQIYMMQAVRSRGSSGENTKFHQQLLLAQQHKVLAMLQLILGPVQAMDSRNMHEQSSNNEMECEEPTNDEPDEFDDDEDEFF
ncbi:hypothetical protein CPB84DRAFT_1749218 [Gymnopilus junonius]|uniref:Uncharacterized protein n=1 Tax=Gymnopilus junonius TaxID=109634 RepID=A0A9P5NGJ4_GYMJU|nr:hypothetical protein CPB84DRAFT_1749218 [Gymnopilus junonius]